MTDSFCPGSHGRLLGGGDIRTGPKSMSRSLLSRKVEEGKPHQGGKSRNKRPAFPRALTDLGEGEKAGLGRVAKAFMTTTYLLSTYCVPDTVTSVLP